MSYDVFGVGNAIVDLQLKIDDAFLDHIRVQKGLMTLVEAERQVEVLATLADRAVSRCSGGSACNTVVGVAHMGGTGAYACKTGNDDLGEFYVNDLRKLGVAVPIAASDGITGTSVILITPDAQRTMLTHLGISSKLAAGDLPEEEIAKSKYLYIEGYLFPGDDTRAAALKAIEIAKAHGVQVALSLSDAWVVGTCRTLCWELVRGPVDLLFANKEEAKALVGSDDPIECARTIHRHATNVALTLGADGSMLMHGNEIFPVEGVRVDAVDTTGAGDMYAAGVLYGLTHGLSWQQAGRLGSHAAAKVVAQMGARLPRAFTADEIRSLAG